MKKLLLTLTVVATGFMAQSQVICAGISPASIAGNYDHTWADPGGGDWSTPDFLIPGTFIVDTLMMSDDGTTGTNPQGNPMSAEACNPPQIVDLTGKIAVVYRNTCEFGFKALACQQAGAVGVIIINRDDEAIGMGGGAEGLNVTIPVVMVSSSTGALLTSTMQNGPVVMFLGNKTGAYNDDAGADKSQMLIADFGGSNSAIFNGFTPGIQVYNFGINTNDVAVTASIDGPGGNVYSETITRTGMATGDTLSIFAGNAEEFTAWDLGIGNYTNGNYTLTYSISVVGIGTADDSDFDNILTADFTIQDGVIASSRVDGSNNPIANSYPSNSTVEYQSCMFFEDANASDLGVYGVTFVPYTDTSATPLAGEEIFINFYEWNDTWVDLDDPNFAAFNDFFTNLNPVGFETYYPASDNETGQPQFVQLSNPFAMVDNQRYLVCLQSFNPEVAFGYDSELDYNGNQGIYRMPISPVFVDDTWYTGWSGLSSPSIAINVMDAGSIGIDEITSLEGNAFPNPAVDKVTIAVNANGAATLSVTDVAGKVAMTENITLVDGRASINIDALASGVYVFNVALENGLSSQFNVVKK